MVIKTRKPAAQKKTQKVRVTITVDSVLLTASQAAAVKAKTQAKYRGRKGYNVSVINVGRW